MRDNDGRKLDHKTLEQVRIRVVRQVEDGARPEYLAGALGFARSTVFGWMARYREGGLEALKARQYPVVRGSSLDLSYVRSTRLL